MKSLLHDTSMTFESSRVWSFSGVVEKRPCRRVPDWAVTVKPWSPMLTAQFIPASSVQKVALSDLQAITKTAGAPDAPL